MEDNNIDRYIKESSKSYKDCKVKNSARRNSLMKKTLGLEVQRKKASVEHSREERLLREQLKHMQIERTKASIVSSMRDGSKSKRKISAPDGVKSQKPHTDLDLDPYPVTFSPDIVRSRANTLDNRGKRYAAARGRRESKEFEDLHLNTATGKLALSHLQHLAVTSSAASSPYSLSPPTPRRRLNSSSSVDSNGESHWAGDPQAIGSVRRPRKSVEEQERDKIAKKEARIHNAQ